MAQAAKMPGSMTAVKSSAKKIQPLLDEWKLDVVIANQNSPRQVVLSGSTDAIEKVEVLVHRLSSQEIVDDRLPFFGENLKIAVVANGFGRFDSVPAGGVRNRVKVHSLGFLATEDDLVHHASLLAHG